MTIETAKIAHSVVNSLAGNPIILAMTVFNILFLAFVLYSTIEERSWRERVVIMLVETQQKSAEQLLSCIPIANVPALIQLFRPDPARQ